jgi:hypothetical protein
MTFVIYTLNGLFHFQTFFLQKGYLKRVGCDIASQKSFFQAILGRDLGIRRFFPYFSSPNRLIPAKTFLEVYTMKKTPGGQTIGGLFVFVLTKR